MSEERNHRKVRQGVVVSIMGNKSIVVETTERKRHPKYGKMMTQNKKFHCHDENCEANVGDTVRIMETRPLSATKRWRLVEIIERAK
ncbi:MAG: 30S ribosomal protein S17 [Coriobacteriales bacterium]|nr:30S ribosomal protein S17 [Coriobacteriales bacterium]